jgi:hypothetical protein
MSQGFTIPGGQKRSQIIYKYLVTIYIEYLSGARCELRFDIAAKTLGYAIAL